MIKTKNLTSPFFKVLFNLMVTLTLSLGLSTFTNAEQDFVIDPLTSKAIPKHLAKVKFKKGDVFRIDEDGKKSELGQGGKIQKGDTVETGQGSFVSFEVIDDSIISLGANSKFVFSQFEFKDKKDRKSVYNFLQGQMRANIPNKAKPGDLEFKSKSVSMGVRGTIFLANRMKQGTNPDGEEIFESAVLEGKVLVRERLAGEKKDNELAVGDHYISENGENPAMHMKQLSVEEVNNYLKMEADPSKEQLPLLDPFQGAVAKVGTGSSLRKPASLEGHGGEERPAKGAKVENEGNKKGFWRNSLQKLNDVLHHYNEND